MSTPDTFKEDFERLIRAFEAIASIPSGVQREYTLSRTASFHGLTRAEMRRLYGCWIVERVGGKGGVA